MSNVIHLNNGLIISLLNNRQDCRIILFLGDFVFKGAKVRVRAYSRRQKDDLHSYIYNKTWLIWVVIYSKYLVALDSYKVRTARDFPPMKILIHRVKKTQKRSTALFFLLAKNNNLPHIDSLLGSLSCPVLNYYAVQKWNSFLPSVQIGGATSGIILQSHWLE